MQDILFIGFDKTVIARIKGYNNYSVFQMLFINSTNYVIDDISTQADNHIVIKLRRAI